MTIFLTFYAIGALCTAILWSGIVFWAHDRFPKVKRVALAAAVWPLLWWLAVRNFIRNWND